MAKEELNQMCREYQEVLVMSEEEILAKYEESNQSVSLLSRLKLTFGKIISDIDIKV